MLVLLLGLAIFLGSHSVRIVAEPWRARRIQALGEHRWKALYSLVSVAGFALIVWGYGMTRADSVDLWNPPLWTRHAAALLTLPVFVMVAAAYVPATHIRARLHHPMVAGIKLWAFAHLLANGRLGDVVLFGSILLWAVFDFKTARARDRAAHVRYIAAPGLTRDFIAIAIGLAIWVWFAFYLHEWLIGVRPLG